IAAISWRPQAADLVACTDVLEHIEPECIGAVLDDIASLVRHLVFLVIATQPAKKTLADGRNAHLIQEPVQWWAPPLMRRWDTIALLGRAGEFPFIGKPL